MKFLALAIGAKISGRPGVFFFVENVGAQIALDHGYFNKFAYKKPQTHTWGGENNYEKSISKYRPYTKNYNALHCNGIQKVT